ncbi:hypothetical protein [Nonomuraea lactucae]|uniref:hypothetical protein n=1 Tax=Nonomuraea lactucae TaxID=2249762 RepID=UPI000DE1F4D1|nr:hypothetical protein [Nonomuraea lactucae]
MIRKLRLVTLAVGAFGLIIVIYFGVASQAKPAALPQTKFATQCERFRLVALNAFMATSGDYDVNTAMTSGAMDCSSPSITVEISPRVAGPNPPRWGDKIKMLPSGEIQNPDLRSWRYSEILRAVGAGGQGDATDEIGDSSKLLHRAPGKLSALALVVLAQPLPEKQVLALWASPQSMILSPAIDGKSLVWEETTFCTFRGFDACSGRDKAQPITSEFRKWVSQLTSQDTPMLAKYGLTLSRLRVVADKGLIYGFTLQNLPGPLKGLAKDPRVKSVYIIDATRSFAW